MTQYINRPPRIQPELPSGTLDIPNPPSARGMSARLSLLTLGLPLITILGYALISSRTGNALFMLPMGLAVIASSVVGFMTWKRNQQVDLTNQHNYSILIGELRGRMEQAHRQQQEFYNHNHPSPDTMVNIVKSKSPRIWERRMEDDDFCAIRLGIGAMPSRVTFRAPSVQNPDAPQLVDAMRLVDEYALVQNVPITIPLKSVHAIGISSNNRQLISRFCSAILVNLTGLHAPTDVRLHIISSPEAKANWLWAQWLPHSGYSIDEGNRNQQLCFDTEQEQVFWENIQTELERRQAQQEQQAPSSINFPHLVVVVDMFSATSISLLEKVAAETAVSMLLNYGKILGATVVFLVSELQIIPGECKAIIELGLDASGGAFRYREVGVNATRLNGVADQIRLEQMEADYARHLSSLAVRTTYGADLPTSLTLLELYGQKSIADLPIAESWAASRAPRENWPQLRFAMMRGGKPRDLTLHSDADGVHGLIAGTTGTGKSELLMTLIIGLAIRYDPTIINFVLVDYKGGTSFSAFRQLPHAVDVITNLQGQAGLRAFTAIRAEINRRSRIIAEARVADIGEYHRTELHLHEPLPHLLIIIDEFAQMIKERPEFKTQLEAIAQLGRALGVHLILATQRPSGVVSDQIRANMKFRICLRVETSDDSRELLGRADAAFLPPNIPGRAYLQVGNERIDLIQVARVGNTYQTGTQQSPLVVWKRRIQSEIQGGGTSKTNTLAQVLATHMDALARELNTPVQKKPWLDPLPERIYLGRLNAAVDDWMNERGEWRGVDWNLAMRVDIGLIDNPIEAKQPRLTLDFMAGHAVVFGASGWGKTTFLRSVIVGLASVYSPIELNIYLLDFGGRGLDVFSMLPHTAAWISPFERERVQRLFRRLDNMIEQRREVFSRNKVNNFAQYNLNHPQHPVPGILIVLDNFAEFRETYPDELEKLAAIARDGRAYGIHLLITAEQMAAVPSKIYSLFTERLALRLAETSEYHGIVGRGVSELPEITGRGLVRFDRMPLEFQVAQPTSLELEHTSENARLSAFSEHMAECWGDLQPESIEVLPAVVSLQSLELTEPQDVRKPPIGIWDADLKPAFLDFKSKPHLAVVGPSLTGKTTTLRSLLISLALQHSPQRVSFAVVDFQQRLYQYGGERQLAEIPHVLMSASDSTELEQLACHLESEFESRSARSKTSDVYVLIDMYDDITRAMMTRPALSPTAANQNVLSQLGRLARQYNAHGLHFVIAGSIGVLRANDDLMKEVMASQHGIGLDTKDSLPAFGARIRNVPPEMPVGRGFVVRAGQSSLVQIATPQFEGIEMEDSLDWWVETLIQKYHTRAQWTTPVE